jgi:hypothetical protein
MDELNTKIQMILDKMVTTEVLTNELKQFATKEDLKQFATKEDLKQFATKDELKKFVTIEYFEQFKMDILDQLFVFEKEFGDKITSIYDYVSLQNDKYNKVSQDNHNIESRVTRVEANYFNLDKRVSVLEMKKK